jgi:hypothetical protein
MSLLDLLTEEEIAGLVRRLPDAVLARYVRRGAVSVLASSASATGIGAELRMRGFWPVVEAAAVTHHVSTHALCGKTRTKALFAARCEVMRAMHASGMSLTEIGAVFDRDHTSVLNAIRPGAKTAAARRERKAAA